MSRHFITLLFVSVLLLSLLSGCAPRSKRPTPTLAVTPTPGSPPGGPITLTDDTGREVTLERLPQRIVVAGRATFIVVNTLLAFPEGRERLVTGESRDIQSMDFYRVMIPHLDPEHFLEKDAGPEQIAAFNPDIVLMKSYMVDKLGPGLDALGIPYIGLDLETPEQFYADLRLLGKLLGNEARAEALIDFYHQQLDALEQRRADVEERPRVLVLSYSDKGGEVAFKVPPRTWIQTTEVVMAGGDPVWAQDVEGGGWNVVGLEQIAAWQPEVIFVIAYNRDSGEVAAKLRTDPNWATLPAGQQGAIYGVPTDYYSWDTPDPHWLLGVIWMSTKLHPEAYADLDMIEKVKLFYRTVYDFTDAQIEETIVPRLTGDIR